MRPLRERLSSLRVGRGGRRLLAESGGPRTPSAAAFETGTLRSEHLIPLASRGWLPQLPAADPQLAALLTVKTSGTIPALPEWLFLDLETTGISGGTGTYAFLVGIAQLTAQGLRVRQYFLRDLGSEADLLAALLPILSRASLLVTYNGKLFDVPLLDTRIRLSRLSLDLDSIIHLDLLHPARQLWKWSGESLRLVDLERQILGYARPPDVPGHRIPRLYFDYLRFGQLGPLERVFRHNRADLVSLAALTARILTLLGDPERTGCEPCERLGLARLFERSGDLERARRLYEKGLVLNLPGELRQRALHRLSLLYKREQNYARAVELWNELVSGNDSNNTAQALSAYQELAIWHEHRIRDLRAALESTERALAVLGRRRLSSQQLKARWQRRHRRLIGKWAREPHPAL